MNHFYQSNNTLIKYVDLNKAILWKTREISISQNDYKKLDNEEITYIEYKDIKKGTSLIFTKEIFKGYAELKKEGQELQYYIKIDLSKKIKSEVGFV